MTPKSPASRVAKSPERGTVTTSYLVALSLQLGSAVAIPTVFLAIGGHAMDERYGTGSVWLLVGLILGFISSIGLVWKIGRAAQQKIDTEH